MTDSSLPGHMSDETLAGYIDGTLANADRAALEAHLADCFTCRSEVLAASQAVDSAPAPERRARAAVMVAAVVAAVAIGIARRESTVANEHEQTRGQRPTQPDSAVIVVAPRSGMTVPAGGIDFVWRRAPEILEYTITVQDVDGRVVWSRSTADTTVRLPDSVTVSRGSVLHWYVDGLQADGRAIGTGRQQVTVR